MNTAAAEWIKLRTLRSTWWALGGGFLVMATFAPVTAMTSANNYEAQGAPLASVPYAVTAIDVMGYFVVFLLIAPAVLAVTGEYATGTIVPTLQCVPERGGLLLAKAGVVAGLGFAAGVPAGILGTFTGGPMLGEYGVLDGGPTAGKILAMGVFAALVSVFAMAVGVVLRSAAGTVIALFTVMLVLPMVLLGFGEVLRWDWLAELSEYFPSTAGVGFMSGDDQPFGPGVALLILATWAGGALAAAHRVLTRRDA
ncbi:ABC transporter [Streptomyces sp. NPDC000410]|uniref:ABC transporter n=1 Tax=Streptomyces sp. NPDC000410 TaxID=3154254 RepID=UPI003324E77F